MFQVGLSRSTTGCVAACLFREFQLSASYEGLVETVPGVNLEVLRMDNYQMDKVNSQQGMFNRNCSPNLPCAFSRTRTPSSAESSRSSRN